MSKWDVAYLSDDAQCKDVTMMLVKLFDPDEETLKVAKEIQTQDPVPLEELEAHEH